MTTPHQQLDELLGASIDACGDGPLRDELVAVRSVLHQPLRIAIAGRMKSGKSTLLNAMVGEPIAPTGATECTKVVTTYREGSHYRATATLPSGERRELRIERSDRAADVDLGSLAATDIECIDVEWPSVRLRDLVLIDTPGLDSATVDPPRFDTDAVIYVMRHLHPADRHFLEAFRDAALGDRVAVNAVGVLSRSDELGSGASDSMEVAAEVAAELAGHPVVQRLCSTVVAVAGLLGIAAATLTEADYQELASAAAQADIDDRLLSVDRFGAQPARRLLLDRLGLFGVRQAIAAIGRGEVQSSAAMSEIIGRLSGLDGLQSIVDERFRRRAGTLQIHQALRTLTAVLSRHDDPEARRLRRECERIRTGAHDLRELHALTLLRTGMVETGDDDGVDLDLARLLGAHDDGAGPRLGLGDDAGADEIRAAAVSAVSRWRRFGSHPLATPVDSEVALIAVRTAEGLAAG